MARPKKPRFYNGVQLEDNLYLDPRKREFYWRYTKPDGSNTIFKETSVERANAIARKGNATRDQYVAKLKAKAGLTILGVIVEDYIEYRETNGPSLTGSKSWQNRCYALRKYAREITAQPHKISREEIELWWNTLSYSDQKLRHAEFRKLYNYMMGRGLTPQLTYNPFTTADDRPRLYLKAKPERARARLSNNEFWQVYQAAGQLDYKGLQIAMGLSLITFMREQDILTLRFDENVKGDILQRIISKSEAQKGHAKAARLQWDTASHPLLKQLIQQARELSMRNARCPFLVSHMPKRIYKSRVKKHHAQISKERLAEQFRDARDAVGIWAKHPSPPTFHEVRSLGDMLASKAGFDIKVIQHAMAHSDEAMTAMYQANHESPYEAVKVIFTPKMIGGFFELAERREKQGKLMLALNYTQTGQYLFLCGFLCSFCVITFL